MTRPLEFLAASRLRHSALIVFLTFLAPAPANAQIQLSGNLRLGWSDCRGAGGEALQTFACDINTTDGATQHTLISSCVAPDGLTSLNSAEMTVEVWLINVEALQPWWELGPSGCRGLGNAVVSYSNPTEAGCLDYWNNVAGGPIGLSRYSYPTGYPCRAIFQHTVAVDPTALKPNTPNGAELYLATITLGNGATLSCAGCQVPACIGFTYCRLVQSEGSDFVIQDSPNSQSLNEVSWQNVEACTIGPDIDFPPCQGTATRHNTWGAIKAIYR